MIDYKTHEFRGCTFLDYPGSNSVKFITTDIECSAPGCPLDIPLQPGDVVVDIGAHVGIISILMAKQYPEVKFYAFEPMTPTYEALELNIIANNTPNVIPHHFGVAGQECIRTMAVCFEDNSAGATMWASMSADNPNYPEKCITADQVWELTGHADIKLLKMDCEGAEHEFIRASLNSEFWKHVHHCVGELHENELLNKAGYSNKATQATLGQITSGTVRFQAITMAQ